MPWAVLRTRVRRVLSGKHRHQHFDGYAGFRNGGSGLYGADTRQNQGRAQACAGLAARGDAGRCGTVRASAGLGPQVMARMRPDKAAGKVVVRQTLTALFTDEAVAP